MGKDLEGSGLDLMEVLSSHLPDETEWHGLNIVDSADTDCTTTGETAQAQGTETVA
jgi:hypothetical protein